MEISLFAVQVTLQAISSTALSVGLIYTAIQFRQFRKVQHFSNFARLVEAQMHLREMRVNDPTLAEVYRHDVEHAKSTREVREYFFNLMQLSVFEIVWFGYRHGQLPEDYFRSWERRVREIAAEPSFRRMIFSPSMKIMHDDFQQYIAGLMKDVPPRPEALAPQVVTPSPDEPKRPAPQPPGGFNVS